MTEPMSAERLAEYLLECGHQTHYAEKDLAIKLINDRDKARDAVLSATQGVDYKALLVDELYFSLSTTDYKKNVLMEDVLIKAAEYLTPKAPTAAPDAWNIEAVRNAAFDEAAEFAENHYISNAKKIVKVGNAEPWRHRKKENSPRQLLANAIRSLKSAAPKANQSGGQE